MFWISLLKYLSSFSGLAKISHFFFFFFFFFSNLAYNSITGTLPTEIGRSLALREVFALFPASLSTFFFLS